MELELAAGAHVCQLYETFDDLKRVTLPFLAEGLASSERCRFITTETQADDWYDELQAYGIDVNRELNRGALEVVTERTWGEPDSFNSVVRSAKVWQYIEGSLRRFSGVRFVGDQNWESEPPLSADKLTHWEATADLLFEGVNVRAICQYNLRDSSPDTILAALRTHPTVLFHQERYDNPFCEAEQILALEPDLNPSYADARLIQKMLAQLKKYEHKH